MGFRSPLPFLGLSAPSAAAQGGYITLPWWQAGKTAEIEQGGFITLPWWQGGGSYVPEPVLPSRPFKGRIKWQRNARDDQDISEIVEILLISRVMDLD